MVAHMSECTKTHLIIYFKWENYMAHELYLKKGYLKSKNNRFNKPPVKELLKDVQEAGK